MDAVSPDQSLPSGQATEDRADRHRPAQQAGRSRSGRPSRSVVNFWLDVVLLAVFMALVSVSAIIQFVFPRASMSADWTLWSLNYDDWAAVQFGTLCVLAAGLILHVMLHWTWVCGMVTRGRPESSLRTDDGIRTIVGVGFLIGLLHVIGAVVLAGLLMVRHP